MSFSSSKLVTLYTDGACSGNPGPGGYGVVLLYGEHRKELSGGYRWTTNNRMELWALIMGLEALKQPCQLQIHTDSKYLMGGFVNQWLRLWKRKGWKTKNGQGVLNQDLWQGLDDLLRAHQFEFIWVKGHGDNNTNNRCDALAVAATKSNPCGIDKGYEMLKPFRG